MATSLTMNRMTIRRIAAAIAFAMLIASLPPAGVTFVANRSGATCFTLDICHPLQSLDRAPAAIAIARPAPPALLSYSAKWEPIAELASSRTVALVLTPDPPPPKHFA
jgi:hypothetical protein